MDANKSLWVSNGMKPQDQWSFVILCYTSIHKVFNYQYLSMFKRNKLVCSIFCLSSRKLMMVNVLLQSRLLICDFITISIVFMLEKQLLVIEETNKQKKIGQ